MASFSSWVSSHGAGGILAPDSAFKVKTERGWPVIQPTDPNKLSGYILFPLPSLPQNTTHLSSLKVDFASNTASIYEALILCGRHTVFRETDMQETATFTLKIPTISSEATHEGKGLAVSLGVEFNHVEGKIGFSSVGIEAAVAPEGIKFDSGTWSVTEVRPWNMPREKTEAHIAFSTKFMTAPKVMVGMNGADVGGNGNFRVNVYATGVDTHGFVVHADTWSDTKLYSCGVWWMAIGH